jgi:putative transposase
VRKTSTKRKRVKGPEERRVVEFFVRNGQCLLPMLELIEESRMAVDELIDLMGRSAVEAVLELSAQEVAGAKSQGRRTKRRAGVGWHGKQWGSVRLCDRKLRLERPRLRDAGGEVEIPAYEVMRHNGRLGGQMLRSLLHGVSTRNYGQLLREMAATAGVSKSKVSREFVNESEARLKELCERNFESQQLLVIYVDGMVFGDHHLLAAVGIDKEGFKHVLGVGLGSSENAVVAKGLLTSLVERGLDAETPRLFVIDGAKALRKAVKEVFGELAVVQRCRAHKLRNVIGYLPEHLQKQVAAVMRAAYKLPYKEGLARLRTQAAWLQKQYPQAAASMLEGLEETFTVNRLNLTSTLLRSVTTTNMMENPNGTVRRQTGRVCRWQDGTMVLRWAASALLSAEKRFNRINGYRDLWMLENGLKDLVSTKPAPEVVSKARVA